MKALVAVFLLALRVYSQDVLSSKCRPTWFAERLGKYPDALEVLTAKAPLYSLVFQSEEPKPDLEMQCLRTTNITVDRSSWLASVAYEYRELEEQETVRIHGTVVASTLHKRNSYISDNTIAFYSGQPPEGTPLATLEVIYNDNHCILTQSQVFGFQVWVTTSYLTTKDEVPYTCTLLYEICSGKAKHFVYNIANCQNDPAEGGK
uniref:Putative lipocalin n=1 Tax=Ixodes ricinus TaxID=34613 RepID=A0A147BW51_IXORI